MDDWVPDSAANVAAGRELGRRLPYWTVWYGEHTGRFWAVPRGGGLSAAPHIEAVTAEELEGVARHIERVFAEWRTSPSVESRAFPEAPDRPGGPAETGSPSSDRRPR